MEGNFPEEIRCPICFEIPPNEIYLCNNGHMICDGCCKTLKECPQCREKYEEKKVRNRPLEDLLLNSMRVDCSFKSKGCSARVLKRELSSHTENCEFGGTTVRFCDYLGYDCGALLNTQSVPTWIDHLVTQHDFLLRQNVTNAEIVLEEFSSFDLNSNSIWTPVILQHDNNQHSFMFFCSYNKEDKHLGVACLHVGTGKDFGNATELPDCKFKIQSANNLENPDIQWTTPAFHIYQVFSEHGTRKLYFRFHVNLLRSHFVIDEALKFQFSMFFGDMNQVGMQETEVISTINHSITDDNLAGSVGPSAPPSLSTALESLSLLPPASAPPPDTTTNSTPESLEVAQKKFFECMNCKQSIGQVYKCLQCPEYNFCYKCMAMDVHKMHQIFAAVCKKEQFLEIWRKLRVNSDWIPMFPNSLSLQGNGAAKSFGNGLCSSFLCGKPLRWICLQCRPVVGFCRKCGIMKFKKHPNGHILALITEEKIAKEFLANLPETY